MQIVAASEQTIEDVTRLMIALWPDCDYAEELEHNRTLIQSPENVVLLARDKSISIGFAHISLRHDFVEGTETSPVGYVEGLYIVPEYRESGMGRALVKAGEAWSKQKGCTEFASDVEIGNTKSLAFHKKIGFEEVNRVICLAKKI